MRLELVPIPVSDVDRAKRFYVEKVGFGVDHDVVPAEDVRVVQLTPNGSACSIVLGQGLPGLERAGAVRGHCSSPAISMPSQPQSMIEPESTWMRSRILEVGFGWPALRIPMATRGPFRVAVGDNRPTPRHPGRNPPMRRTRPLSTARDPHVRAVESDQIMQGRLHPWMRSQLSEPCGSELRRRWSICAPDPAMALIYGLDFYVRSRRQNTVRPSRASREHNSTSSLPASSWSSPRGVGSST